MRATRLLSVAVAAMLFAACSKPSPSPANVAAGAAPSPGALATVAPLAATPASAGAAGPIALADLPAPPAGEWKRASSQDGAAPETYSKCLDGKPIDPADGMPNCAKMTAVRTATGGFVVDGDCSANGVKAILHMAGEGDFKRSFTTDAQMTLADQGKAPMTVKNHSVWSFVGAACPK